MIVDTFFSYPVRLRHSNYYLSLFGQRPLQQTLVNMKNPNSDDYFTKTSVLLISILIISNIPIYTSQLVNECPNEEDYSPCTCSSSSSDIIITCDSIPLDQIQDVFKRTSPVDVYQLKLTVNSLDTSGIPFEFLVNKR